MNRIYISGFSNPETGQTYRRIGHIEDRKQCGGCSFYAPFNLDWGLCCFKKSHHYLETVFEHFGCKACVYESWEAHSFSECPEHHHDVGFLLSILEKCQQLFALNHSKSTRYQSRTERKLQLKIEHYLRLHCSKLLRKNC